MSIKYYQLAKGEELPEEFCVVRDVNGEPGEYTFYVPEAENAKLHSICAEVAGILFSLDVDYCSLCDRDSINHPCPVHTVKSGECLIESELRELGVEMRCA